VSLTTQRLRGVELRDEIIRVVGGILSANGIGAHVLDMKNMPRKDGKRERSLTFEWTSND